MQEVSLNFGIQQWLKFGEDPYWLHLNGLITGIGNQESRSYCQQHVNFHIKIIVK